MSRSSYPSSFRFRAAGALAVLLLLSLAFIPTAAAAETWESISPDAFENLQPALPVGDSSAGPTVLALQWMLERAGYSPGVMDGRWGSNTVNALRAFQTASGIEASDQADQATWDKLSAAGGEGEGPLAQHEISAKTAEGPFVDVPEDYMEQAELDCLCFASLAEAVAEELHTTPEVLELLNPGVDMASLSAGDTVLGPAVGGPDSERGKGGEVASLLISKGDFYLRALDADGNIVYHFPTTVGADYDPSPDGELKITAIATDPTFHYQPDHFADVPDDKPEAMLPAGPNNPVGVVWIQLSKDNYGIHGTAEPSTIGHSTSHGCIRLTNWDAAFLTQRVGEGLPVKFTGGGDSGETAEDTEDTEDDSQGE